MSALYIIITPSYFLRTFLGTCLAEDSFCTCENIVLCFLSYLAMFPFVFTKILRRDIPWERARKIVFYFFYGRSEFKRFFNPRQIYLLDYSLNMAMAGIPDAYCSKPRRFNNSGEIINFALSLTPYICSLYSVLSHLYLYTFITYFHSQQTKKSFNRKVTSCVSFP